MSYLSNSQLSIRQLLFRLLGNFAFWTIIFTTVLGIRYYDIGNIAFINLPVHIPTYRIFLNGLILGTSVSLFYTFVEIRLESVSLYNNSFGRIIFLRTVYLFLVSAITLTAVAILNYKFDVWKGTIDHTKVAWLKYVFSSTVRFLLLGALMGNFILSVFHTLRSKMSHKDFMNLLTGKYRNPQEENRVFMFLDLRSSTTIAEKLGHNLYSRLVQDCFKDLTETLIRTDAEVYQYVGDEAVLSWSADVAFQNDKCLLAQMYFEGTLNSRKEYYEKNYGLLPVFKAGLNIGEATVVEVGVLKRTIVYHGDVLNTAARIQSLCNDYNKTLLVSEDIKHMIKSNAFDFELIGDILLKGKTEKVKVYEPVLRLG